MSLSSANNHVVQLLNEAHAKSMFDSDAVLTTLARLRELMVLQRPNDLIPESAHEIFEFRTNVNAKVRKYVIKFGEDMAKKHSPVLLHLVPTCTWLLHDKSTDVVKRVISCLSNVAYPKVLCLLKTQSKQQRQQNNNNCSIISPGDDIEPDTKQKKGMKISDIVDLWHQVTDATRKVVDVFQSASNKALLASAATHLVKAILAMTSPSSADLTVSASSSLSRKSEAKNSLSESSSLFSIPSPLPDGLSTAGLESRADGYIQLLIMRCNELWSICIQALRTIAISRSKKLGQILIALHDLAHSLKNNHNAKCRSSDLSTSQQREANKKIKKPHNNAALRACLRTNLMKIWKCFYKLATLDDNEVEQLQKLVMEGLIAAGMNEEKVKSHWHEVHGKRKRKSVKFVQSNLRKKKREPYRKSHKNKEINYAKAKQPSSLHNKTSVKISAERPAWKSLNIATMMQLEKMPLHILVQLFQTNLKHLPTHLPSSCHTGTSTVSSIHTTNVKDTHQASHNYKKRARTKLSNLKNETKSTTLSSVALKLMENMGYQPGQGLGAKSDGSILSLAETIESRGKADGRGLGFVSNGKNIKTKKSKQVGKGLLKRRTLLPAAPVASPLFFDSMRLMLFRRLLHRGLARFNDKIGETTIKNDFCLLSHWHQQNRGTIMCWVQLVARIGWTQRKSTDSITQIINFCRQCFYLDKTSSKNDDQALTCTQILQRDLQCRAATKLLSCVACLLLYSSCETMESKLPRCLETSGPSLTTTSNQNSVKLLTSEDRWTYDRFLLESVRLTVNSPLLEHHQLILFLQGLPCFTVPAAQVVFKHIISQRKSDKNSENSRIASATVRARAEVTKHTDLAIIKQRSVSEIVDLLITLSCSQGGVIRSQLQHMTLNAAIEMLGHPSSEVQTGAISYLGSRLSKSMSEEIVSGKEKADEVLESLHVERQEIKSQHFDESGRTRNSEVNLLIEACRKRLNDLVTLSRATCASKVVTDSKTPLGSHQNNTLHETGITLQTALRCVHLFAYFCLSDCAMLNAKKFSLKMYCKIFLLR